MGCVVSRPVPYIDSGAYVSGHPAAFLAMLPRRVSATSEFSNLHPHDQENVLATIEAIQLAADKWRSRSEEHTSELQSLMRSTYAVFCLKKKKNQNHINNIVTIIIITHD